ncbi:type II toxin-antitoxin system RelB/DinJ family antitoxin [Enterococcus mediterraneensis]|uniref:type II toxin-antitoxin system RelB/DinJ family antitoxin n=1 Tax=Enterococcus mediterraneensis TaxID=2364791 RepID=UPI000F0596C3|nr:type II toxin-antitoxin system RelB/DinJ family antitoxin [Enterococcus mediterraneensis]
METKERKKKIQVNIDRSLANDVDAILESLGLNQTTLITALYKRVAAQGEVPFSLALTKEEKINLELMDAIDLIPTQHISTAEELSNWLDEDE